MTQQDQPLNCVHLYNTSADHPACVERFHLLIHASLSVPLSLCFKSTVF
jgi:hypothetical protein